MSSPSVSDDSEAVREGGSKIVEAMRVCPCTVDENQRRSMTTPVKIVEPDAINSYETALMGEVSHHISFFNKLTHFISS